MTCSTDCQHPATFRIRPIPRAEVISCLKCGHTQITVNGQIIHEQYYAAPILVGFSNDILRVIRDYLGNSNSSP